MHASIRLAMVENDDDGGYVVGDRPICVCVVCVCDGRDAGRRTR